MSTLGDRRAVRRLLSIGALVVLWPVLLVISPAATVIAVLADLIRGRRWFPTVRGLWLLVIVGAIELAGLMAATIVWLRTLGRGGADRRDRLYTRLFGRYTSTLLAVVPRVLGTEVRFRNIEPLPDGPVIVLARHTSFVDAVVPGALIAQREGRLPLHVLTSGLRWAPCIDVVGHRTPTCFVKRRSDAVETQLARIGDLGALVDDTRTGVIFPEGTFRTPRRFDRALVRLEGQPELSELARSLQHGLPPRSGGSAALLGAAPDAAVVIIAHTGFEGWGTLLEMLQPPRATRPIVIDSWVVGPPPSADDGAAFATWLMERWIELDAWVEQAGG